jgi:integrase/recombinase XerC
MTAVERVPTQRNSLLASMERFLSAKSESRSEATARTYANALGAFQLFLDGEGIDPAAVPARQAREDWIAGFASYLRPYAPASERLYLTAVAGWYEYLAAETLADLNLPQVRHLIRQRARRPGVRLPQFPRDAIEEVIQYALRLGSDPGSGESETLRNRRDAAFLVLLADTGLRVHEACSLRRGDVDWPESRAVVIGKGNQQAVVRLSKRALSMLKAYLEARATLDGQAGRILSSLPLFARHDRGAGKKVKPISTGTGRAIVHQRATEALGDDHTRAITPHSFRHYFVTTVLRGSGGNLKLAQELARHRSIGVTQRYAHLSDDELDRGYHDIFDAPARHQSAD